MQFDFEKYPYIYIIGSGGKTTLMYYLANRFLNQKYKVITTTTTKILIEKPPSLQKHLTLGKEIKGKKIIGLSPLELDNLYKEKIYDYILVEADGSRGRSLKAHLENEPPISKEANLVIVVIGLDVLGKPLNEKYVFRSKIFGQLVNKEANAIIDIFDINKIIYHPKGYLKNIYKNSKILIFINKVSTNPQNNKLAIQLAQLIQESDINHKINDIVVY